MTNTNGFVRLKNVGFHYRPDAPRDEWALCGVNLELDEGESVALIGPNGSGKSTLTKLINGLLKPLEGEISVGGLNPADDEDVWAVRKQVGIVFQNPDNQIVAPTVRDDIAFGLENLGLPRERMIERVREAVALVGLEGLEDAAPHRLSGGQKQRLAIAGVLAMRPRLLIMDEATTMLDPGGRRDVAHIIRLVKEEGIGTLIVTHQLEDVWDVDRVIIMAGGKIQCSGPPGDVFARGEELLSLGLDVPFAVRMQRRLIERGLPLAEHVQDEKSLVNALWTLWRKT